MGHQDNGTLGQRDMVPTYRNCVLIFKKVHKYDSQRFLAKVKVEVEAKLDNILWPSIFAQHP